MKNKPIHALHRLAVLALLTAAAQSSWGGHCYFYNKSIQIKVVPSAAGKIYADTKSDGSGTLGEDGFDTANIENMRSETGSDIRFDYCMNASYDELYITSTDIATNAKFVLSKVINMTQNEDGTDNTPPY